MEETMRTYYMTSHTSNSTDQLDVGQITVQTHDKRNCENVSLLTVHAAKPEYPAAYSTSKPDDFKGGIFDNMYHLWHRFSEQINLANVHSPQI